MIDILTSGFRVLFDGLGSFGRCQHTCTVLLTLTILKVLQLDKDAALVPGVCSAWTKHAKEAFARGRGLCSFFVHPGVCVEALSRLGQLNVGRL